MRAALSELVKFDRVKNRQSAGTTAFQTDGVQVAEGDSVLFAVIWGTITDGTPEVKAQQSSDNGSSDAFADLANTKIQLAATDDNKVTLLDIRRPLEEYVRLDIDRSVGSPSTGAEVEAVLALVYDSKEEPITQDSDVSGHEKHLAPAEGTA